MNVFLVKCRDCVRSAPPAVPRQKNTDSCSDVTILELSIHRSQQGPLALSGPSPTAIQARLTNANRRKRHIGSGSAIKPFHGSAPDDLCHITAFTSTGWVGEDGRSKIKKSCPCPDRLRGFANIHISRRVDVKD